MILNSEELKTKKYKCNKRIMKYLVYQCGLPILSFDETYYYFTDNIELKAFLRRMPLGLKLLSKFVK